jgi:hypothetical protein
MLEIDSSGSFVEISESMEDLIRLTPSLVEILQQERGVIDAKANETRKFARHRCSSYGIMELIGESNKNLNRQQTSKVVIRDLSRNGFGVFSHEQWYPTQVIRLSLPTGQSICDVARARYHGPACYEIGLQVRKFLGYPKDQE